jgi:hypothetical protein
MLHLNLVLVSFAENLRARAHARVCSGHGTNSPESRVASKIHVLFESRLLYQLEYHASLRL